MSIPVYISIDGKRNEVIRLHPNLTLNEVRSVFCAAAGIADPTEEKVEGSTPGTKVGVVMKLYNADHSLIPIGPHIPKNTPETSYNLRVKMGELNIIVKVQNLFQCVISQIYYCI